GRTAALVLGVPDRRQTHDVETERVPQRAPWNFPVLQRALPDVAQSPCALHEHDFAVRAFVDDRVASRTFEFAEPRNSTDCVVERAGTRPTEAADEDFRNPPCDRRCTLEQWRRKRLVDVAQSRQ